MAVDDKPSFQRLLPTWSIRSNVRGCVDGGVRGSAHGTGDMKNCQMQLKVSITEHVFNFSPFQTSHHPKMSAISAYSSPFGVTGPGGIAADGAGESIVPIIVTPNKAASPDRALPR